MPSGFERAGGQAFRLPAPEQDIDVSARERPGLHVPEARVDQLATGQCQRSQSVALRGMAAIAVALAKQAQADLYGKKTSISV